MRRKMAAQGSMESMGEAEIRRKLLISAAEDYEPLFHALWEFGGSRKPELDSPSEGVVKAVLWQLIEGGLVDLFHGQDSHGEFIPVPAARRRDVFDDPQAWQVAEDPASDFRYSTTAAGDEYVRHLP
jgi:hypothetical protein